MPKETSYRENSTKACQDAKARIHDARIALQSTLAKSRELSLALTKLDEAEMWIDRIDVYRHSPAMSAYEAAAEDDRAMGDCKLVCDICGLEIDRSVLHTNCWAVNCCVMADHIRKEHLKIDFVDDSDNPKTTVVRACIK